MIIEYKTTLNLETHLPLTKYIASHFLGRKLCCFYQMQSLLSMLLNPNDGGKFYCGNITPLLLGKVLEDYFPD